MLDKIVSYKKKRLQRTDLAKEIERLELLTNDLPPTVSMKDHLSAESGTSIIAEIKRQSPSRGRLNDEIDVKSLTQLYELAGARAISVLTEDKFFGGSVEDLKTVKANTSLPVLRKDFIIDEYQIWESRAIGADAILLIVKILSFDELSYFCYLAKQLDLEVIVEVHSREEIERAQLLCPNMVGINNRNLATFETNIITFESLVQYIPYDTLTISESGISSRADILYLQDWGADAFLIGENIITNSDPYAKICELQGIPA